MPNTESSIDLTQIFEPIQADLQAVEQEYARQVESRVELIPQIGKIYSTKWRETDPPGATFDGLAPSGLSR